MEGKGIEWGVGLDNLSEKEVGVDNGIFYHLSMHFEEIRVHNKDTVHS